MKTKNWLTLPLLSCALLLAPAISTHAQDSSPNTTPKQDLKDAGQDTKNAAKKTGQVCEANFYSGEWSLRQGAKDDAAHLFQVAARDCPKTLIEGNAAATELKALGATP